jgi:hypothetical protein
MHYLFISVKANYYNAYLQHLFCIAAAANNEPIIYAKSLDDLLKLTKPGWIIFSQPKPQHAVALLLLKWKIKSLYKKALLHKHVTATPKLLLKNKGLLMVMPQNEVIENTKVAVPATQLVTFLQNYFPPLHILPNNNKVEETTLPASLYYYALGVKTLQQALDLLKVFSIFKKWQLTNTALVMVIKDAKVNNALTEKLENYKYRASVTIQAAYTAHSHQQAYAIIIVNATENEVPKIYNSFFYGVPVLINNIATTNSAIEELVISYQIADQKAFATQLVNLYKNETDRNNLVYKASSWYAQQPSITQQAQQFQQLITAS